MIKTKHSTIIALPNYLHILVPFLKKPEDHYIITACIRLNISLHS